MPHLRSRTEHPPYSFRFLQPETGQTQEFVGSFNAVVEQVMSLRNANPFLAERHGWRTDLAGVEAEVDSYNTARCIAGGWLSFVVMDDGAAQQSAYVMPEKKKPTNAVGSVKRVAAGVAVLLDWLGSGGKAVDQTLADARAAICATCPRNDGGDFTSFFTKPIANKIRLQMEIRGDLQLHTPYDDKLTVCSACSCPLKLKVFTPIQHVLAHTSDEVKKELHPACWILKGT